MMSSTGNWSHEHLSILHILHKHPYVEEFSLKAPVHTEKSFCTYLQREAHSLHLNQVTVSFSRPCNPLFADLHIPTFPPILYTVVSLSDVFQSNLNIPKEKW